MAHTIIRRLSKTQRPARTHDVLIHADGRWEVTITPATTRKNGQLEFYTEAELQQFIAGIARYLEGLSTWPAGKKAQLTADAQPIGLRFFRPK